MQASLQPGTSVFTPVPVAVQSYLPPGGTVPIPAYLHPGAPLPVQTVLPPGVSDSKFATIQSTLPPGSPAYAPVLRMQARHQPKTSVFTPSPVRVPAYLPPESPLPVQPALPPGVSHSKFATIQSSLPSGSSAYAYALPVQATHQPRTSVFIPAPGPAPAYLPPGAPLPVQPVFTLGVSHSKFATIQSSLPPGSPLYAHAGEPLNSTATRVALVLTPVTMQETLLQGERTPTQVPVQSLLPPEDQTVINSQEKMHSMFYKNHVQHKLSRGARQDDADVFACYNPTQYPLGSVSFEYKDKDQPHIDRAKNVQNHV